MSLANHLQRRPSNACLRIACLRRSARAVLEPSAFSISSATDNFRSISSIIARCSISGGKGTATSYNISRFIFFWAVAGAKRSMFSFAVLKKYSAYFTSTYLDSGYESNDTIGKHASNPKIEVSAMFAAIVMHRVPFGHNLLCFNPASE